MTIVALPAVIAALKSIPGAVVPSVPDPRHSNHDFEVETIWKPRFDSDYPGVDRTEDDGGPVLASDPIVDVDEEHLGDLVGVLRDRPSPWGAPGEDGTDALAWYVSFHRDPERWGVYVPVTGLLKFAGYIAPSNRLSGPTWADLIRLALRGLLAHEYVHFAVDFGTAQIELFANGPCYVASRSALSKGHRHVPLEEQLANGASLRSLRWAPRSMKIPGAFQSAVAFTKTQPAGYRDGESAVVSLDFLRVANDLMSQIAGLLPQPNTPQARHPVDYTRFLPLGPLADFRGRPSKMATVDAAQCPVYLVHDEAQSGIPDGAIRLITAIPAIQESKRFWKDLPRELQQEWNRTKTRLADPLYPKNSGEVDLQRWPQEDHNGIRVWSVRLGKRSGYRAHINRLPDGTWLASRVGDKKDMKH